MSHKFGQISRRLIVVSLMALMATAAVSTPARAQDAISKEAATALKASFIADLDVVGGKFLQLANAFPQDKYTWRPMEGVRSVSEVLALVAAEGYGFIPNSFGAKPGGSPEDMAAIRASSAPVASPAKVTDKAKMIDYVTKALAYSKAQLEAADPATLTGRRQVMGKSATSIDAALGIGGDLHEHLGQLIAYARMNHIVPPWSK